jgi:hypothetical protein
VGNLAATFDSQPVSLAVTQEDCDVDDKTYYVRTAEFAATMGTSSWGSQIHFFDRYPQRTEGKISSLCPSIFSSPFSILEPELLADCHSKSLKEGSKELIIEFIQENVDNAILNIELDDVGRYTVLHRDIKPNPDLSMFGEGLQRIFKLGTLFAGARNGILIVDEIENAIHASLLPKVANLLYRLSVKFDVQLFISSHSKECIDAFIRSNEIPPDDLSAYALTKNNRAVIAYQFSGAELNALVTSTDFDLRGKSE